MRASATIVSSPGQPGRSSPRPEPDSGDAVPRAALNVAPRVNSPQTGRPASTAKSRVLASPWDSCVVLACPGVPWRTPQCVESGACCGWRARRLGWGSPPASSGLHLCGELCTSYGGQAWANNKRGPPPRPPGGSIVSAGPEPEHAPSPFLPSPGTWETARRSGVPGPRPWPLTVQRFP